VVGRNGVSVRRPNPPLTTEVLCQDRSVDERAVVVLDENGIVRFWSGGAENILRHQPQEAIGRSVDFIIPGYFRDQHWVAFRQAMTAGVLHEARDQFVVPVQVSEDDVIPLVASLALITDAAGHPCGAVAVFMEQE
jgi:PAS domain S-box-containing protein